jgi:hypothetical protein
MLPPLVETTGASLTGVMAIARLAVLLASEPSLTTNVTVRAVVDGLWLLLLYVIDRNAVW